MAGVLLESVEVDEGEYYGGLRAVKIYDASLYWYNVSSGERHGLGIIGVGRDDGGRDILLPSLDWERDICAYTLGGGYFRDKSCPNVTIGSNGVIAVSSSMMCFNYNKAISLWLNASLGIYCASTPGYTDKLRARDYSTYDSSLHRRAGQSGVVDTDTVVDPNHNYDYFPRPSLFFYDITNSYVPTYCSLLACKNIYVDDVLLRHGQNDPASAGWDDFVPRVASKIPGVMSYGPTFYVPSVTGSLGQMQFLNRYIGTIEIDGDSYNLHMVNIDYPRTLLYANCKYAETPLYKINRNDTSKGGKMYILDEWVTLHKPNQV